jgi:hypothetical protein
VTVKKSSTASAKREEQALPDLDLDFHGGDGGSGYSTIHGGEDSDSHVIAAPPPPANRTIKLIPPPPSHIISNSERIPSPSSLNISGIQITSNNSSTSVLPAPSSQTPSISSIANDTGNEEDDEWDEFTSCS